MWCLLRRKFFADALELFFNPFDLLPRCARGNGPERRLHSRASRIAAAQAKGAAASANRLIAASAAKGAVNPAPPPAAATPKMSAGIVSGSANTAISRPPRRSEAVSAAPMAPIIVSAGVPASSCVYVDALPFNLSPAERLGMATVHHTSAQTTIPQLERLLGHVLR